MKKPGSHKNSLLDSHVATGCGEEWKKFLLGRFPGIQV